MTHRRTFLAGIAALLATPPRAAEPQQAGKLYRIGYLSPGSISSHGPFFEMFSRTLRELGFAEGQNFVVEYRWAEGGQDKLDVYAAELVQLNPAVILTSGTPASLALKRATPTIPIVFVGVADPVESSLVASLPHPGGNITGFSVVTPELSAKRLQLLGTLVPRLARAGVLWNPMNSAVRLVHRTVEVAAGAAGLQLHSFEVRTPSDFEGAFDAAARARIDGLLVIGDPFTVVQRARIVGLAAQHRLPAVYELGVFAKAGGLIAYAPDYLDLYRRAAHVVAKILNGTQPADLPVEEPTKFELVINMKTAKILGLTIPPALLLRADRVI